MHVPISWVLGGTPFGREPEAPDGARPAAGLPLREAM
jgi:hypothetical protein